MAQSLSWCDRDIFASLLGKKSVAPQPKPDPVSQAKSTPPSPKPAPVTHSVRQLGQEETESYSDAIDLKEVVETSRSQLIQTHGVPEFSKPKLPEAPDLSEISRPVSHHISHIETSQPSQIEEVEEAEEIIEDVPFTIIENVPVFPGCKGNNDKLRACFSKKVQRHYSKK